MVRGCHRRFTFRYNTDRSSLGKDTTMDTGNQRPSAALLDLVNGFRVSQAIHVAATLGIGSGESVRSLVLPNKKETPGWVGTQQAALPHA